MPSFASLVLSCVSWGFSTLQLTAGFCVGFQQADGPGKGACKDSTAKLLHMYIHSARLDVRDGFTPKESNLELNTKLMAQTDEVPP